ncbi:MAG: ElyC/SanA/YdcF family protein [Candidatus Omnitrophota bacterium]|nr:ElyC/SanA/YdcF family protein [Candidatus Omnitrophota bacterium]
MLKNENIICISSIDWDFIWQGHQEIMSTFANAGNRVLFIENTGIRPPALRDIPRIKKRIVNWFKSVKGFRKERYNLYIYSPIFIPFPYSRLARWANRYLILSHLKRWLKLMKFDNPIIWTFLPTLTALDIIASIEKKALVYYYIADFDQLTHDSKKLKKAEERLMRECDVIFVQGEYFRRKCLKCNKNVFIFPFGVSKEIFDNFKNKADKIFLEDLGGIKGHIIGYVGGLHRHIDFGLIRYIARSNPQWSIVLIGPIQESLDDIKDLKNVYCLGKKDFTQLPAYINRFDACIVPYMLSEYTNTVYPTKINEYHIMGKPVVSTNLPEVIKHDPENLIFIAKDYEEFSGLIKKALETAKDKDAVARRIKSAEKNSWYNRIEEMSGIIQTAVANKSLEEPLNWREKFIGLYAVSRGKIVKFSSAAVILWLLLFYTPLVWFLAEPLRFYQEPKVSDAIVVFAGGVGESGRPGQGYEERVKHAVELYKRGFAENIIFSSGAVSTFPEPYVMKALAIYLGVPESAVIIEDLAASTYENVKFTDKILDAKKWEKIILISSPYHMRRAALVFAKIAPEKKIAFVPAKSLFYSHQKSEELGGIKKFRQIDLRQINGILHEYLAICYYWAKGYI